MKSLIILALAFSVVSCSRTNPNKKIEEEKKKAVDALKKEDEKILKEEKDLHAKDNKRYQNALAVDKATIANLRSGMGNNAKLLKKVNDELTQKTKELENRKDQSKKVKELETSLGNKVAELGAKNKELESLQEEMAEVQNNNKLFIVDLGKRQAEINRLQKELEEAKKGQTPSELEKELADLKEKNAQLQLELENKKVYNFSFTTLAIVEPAGELGNPGDCFSSSEEAELKRWTKDSKGEWQELNTEDAEAVEKFEKTCSEFHQVELKNKFEIVETQESAQKHKDENTEDDNEKFEAQVDELDSSGDRKSSIFENVAETEYEAS